MCFLNQNLISLFVQMSVLPSHLAFINMRYETGCGYCCSGGIKMLLRSLWDHVTFCHDTITSCSLCGCSSKSTRSMYVASATLL